jgi:pimeloyl-ACP methyl ester carboxylesterase
VIECKVDNGSGRPTVIVSEAGAYYEVSQAIVNSSAEGRVVWLECSPVTDLTWSGLASEALGIWKERKLKQARVVGFGAAAVLAQKIALEDPKEIRSLVIVDGAPVAQQGVWQKILSKLDEATPFGLPFRVSGTAFDARSFLHRLRCPVLLVQYYQGIGELAALEQLIPTASFVDLAADPTRANSLCSEIQKHQSVPAKFPMKGR